MPPMNTTETNTWAAYWKNGGSITELKTKNPAFFARSNSTDSSMKHSVPHYPHRLTSAVKSTRQFINADSSKQIALITKAANRAVLAVRVANAVKKAIIVARVANAVEKAVKKVVTDAKNNNSAVGKYWRGAGKS